MTYSKNVVPASGTLMSMFHTACRGRTSTNEAVIIQVTASPGGTICVDNNDQMANLLKRGYLLGVTQANQLVRPNSRSQLSLFMPAVF